MTNMRFGSAYRDLDSIEEFKFIFARRMWFVATIAIAAVFTFLVILHLFSISQIGLVRIRTDMLLFLTIPTLLACWVFAFINMKQKRKDFEEMDARPPLQREKIDIEYGKYKFCPRCLFQEEVESENKYCPNCRVAFKLPEIPEGEPEHFPKLSEKGSG